MQKIPCALLLLWTHGVLVCAGLGVQDGPCLVRQRRRGFGLASTLVAGTRSITLEQRAAGVEQWVVGAHAWTASKKPPGAHARVLCDVRHPHLHRTWLFSPSTRGCFQSCTTCRYSCCIRPARCFGRSPSTTLHPGPMGRSTSGRTARAAAGRRSTHHGAMSHATHCTSRGWLSINSFSLAPVLIHPWSSQTTTATANTTTTHTHTHTHTRARARTRTRAHRYGSRCRCSQTPGCHSHHRTCCHSLNHNCLTLCQEKGAEAERRRQQSFSRKCVPVLRGVLADVARQCRLGCTLRMVCTVVAAVVAAAVTIVVATRACGCDARRDQNTCLPWSRGGGAWPESVLTRWARRAHAESDRLARARASAGAAGLSHASQLFRPLTHRSPNSLGHIRRCTSSPR